MRWNQIPCRGTDIRISNQKKVSGRNRIRVGSVLYERANSQVCQCSSSESVSDFSGFYNANSKTLGRPMVNETLDFRLECRIGNNDKIACVCWIPRAHWT